MPIDGNNIVSQSIPIASTFMQRLWTPTGIHQYKADLSVYNGSQEIAS